jgi:hypothetical protein
MLAVELAAGEGKTCGSAPAGAAWISEATVSLIPLMVVENLIMGENHLSAKKGDMIPSLGVTSPGGERIPPPTGIARRMTIVIQARRRQMILLERRRAKSRKRSQTCVPSCRRRVGFLINLS